MTAPTITRRYHDSPFADAKPLSPDTVLAERGTHAAANDDVALAIPDGAINPLWVITVGTAFFFVFAAVAIAMG